MNLAHLHAKCSKCNAEFFKSEPMNSEDQLFCLTCRCGNSITMTIGKIEDATV